jgi:hypothetical protein
MGVVGGGRAHDDAWLCVRLVAGHGLRACCDAEAHRRGAGETAGHRSGRGALSEESLKERGGSTVVTGTQQQ